MKNSDSNYKDVTFVTLLISVKVTEMVESMLLLQHSQNPNTKHSVMSPETSILAKS